MFITKTIPVKTQKTITVGIYSKSQIEKLIRADALSQGVSKCSLEWRAVPGELSGSVYSIKVTVTGEMSPQKLNEEILEAAKKYSDKRKKKNKGRK